MTDETKALVTIMRHREIVAGALVLLADQLRERGRVHDRSKLVEDELAGYVRINAVAREHPYGSPEYKESMRSEMGPDGCITKHFARNSHHPEYHDEALHMGWLDIIEMVIDWYAASQTYGTNTFADSVKVQRNRFAFTEEQWWLIDEVVEWLDGQGGDK